MGDSASKRFLHIPDFFPGYRDTLLIIRRNPRIAIGTFIIVFFFFCSVLAPWISPYNPIKVNLRVKYQPPSAEYRLGTDYIGRDILSRLIWGSRVSLCTAVFSVGLAVVIGLFLGVTAGYYGGKVDIVLSRFVDIMLALPAFIMAIALMGVLGRGLANMTIAIGVAMAPRIARLVRGAALTVKETQFVASAKSFGYADWRIIFRHIIPHSLTPMVVYATLSMGSAVMIEAGLSFLGLGIPQPTPTWGQMVSEGANVIRTLPWFSTSAGFMIMILVLGFNMLGDGLRDQLDPRLRGEVRE